MTKRNLNFGLDSYKSIISKFISPVLILGHSLDDASKQKYDSERGWEIWAYILILEFFCFLVLEARKFHFRNKRNLERFFFIFRVRKVLSWNMRKIFPRIARKFHFWKYKEFFNLGPRKFHFLESFSSRNIRNFFFEKSLEFF